jgi:RecA/RadA recombinase
MSNKWLSKLQKLDGAVVIDENTNDLLNVVRSPSPYVNWTFATEGHGLPLGYSMLLGGPPKAGKSFIAYNFIAQLHRDDPTAIAVVFNTEFRAKAQANPESLKRLGIDKDRFLAFDTNTPDGIFDVIAKDINAMCQEGAPIKMIVIDSLSGIQGRRAMNADTVMTQQIGDEAATLGVGLKLILPVIRRHKIATILCTHVRDEMDMHEQMRGNKVRLQAANATKHFAEFFCFVERNKSKTGKTTLDGQEFRDESSQDVMGKGDATGHKIRFKVMDSSVGVNGRTAEFTLDFEKGIVNQYEEIFQLGLNTGVIEKPNNVTYKYGDTNWRGIGACLAALKDDKDLCDKILEDVYRKDSSK